MGDRGVLWDCVSSEWPPCLMTEPTHLSLENLSKDNNNGGCEKTTKLIAQWTKTEAQHAPHVRFTFWYISSAFSPRQRHQIIKFVVKWRT